MLIVRPSHYARRILKGYPYGEGRLVGDRDV
jgi:hypothetical protein